MCVSRGLWIAIFTAIVSLSVSTVHCVHLSDIIVCPIPEQPRRPARRSFIARLAVRAIAVGAAARHVAATAARPLPFHRRNSVLLDTVVLDLADESAGSTSSAWASSTSADSVACPMWEPHTVASRVPRSAGPQKLNSDDRQSAAAGPGPASIASPRPRPRGLPPVRSGRVRTTRSGSAEPSPGLGPCSTELPTQSVSWPPVTSRRSILEFSSCVCPSRPLTACPATCELRRRRHQTLACGHRLTALH